MHFDQVVHHRLVEPEAEVLDTKRLQNVFLEVVMQLHVRHTFY